MSPSESMIQLSTSCWSIITADWWYSCPQRMDGRRREEARGDLKKTLFFCTLPLRIERQCKKSCIIYTVSYVHPTPEPTPATLLVPATAVHQHLLIDHNFCNIPTPQISTKLIFCTPTPTPPAVHQHRLLLFSNANTTYCTPTPPTAYQQRLLHTNTTYCAPTPTLPTVHQHQHYLLCTNTNSTYSTSTPTTTTVHRHQLHLRIIMILRT